MSKAFGDKMKKHVDYGDLKLFPFGTPIPLHGVNPRTMLDKKQWDILRKNTYRSANYTCEICGGKGDNHPVEAHEKFDYDFDNEIQIFLGMIALCPTCHKVIHWQQNDFLLRDGKISYSEYSDQQDAKRDKLKEVNIRCRYTEPTEKGDFRWHTGNWKSDFSKLKEEGFELKSEFDSKYSGIFILKDGLYSKK